VLARSDINDFLSDPRVSLPAFHSGTLALIGSVRYFPRSPTRLERRCRSIRSPSVTIASKARSSRLSATSIEALAAGTAPARRPSRPKSTPPSSGNYISNSILRSSHVNLTAFPTAKVYFGTNAMSFQRTVDADSDTPAAVIENNFARLSSLRSPDQTYYRKLQLARAVLSDPELARRLSNFFRTRPRLRNGRGDSARPLQDIAHVQARAPRAVNPAVAFPVNPELLDGFLIPHVRRRDISGQLPHRVSRTATTRSCQTCLCCSRVTHWHTAEPVCRRAEGLHPRCSMIALKEEQRM
jgi:hypothetical protein